MNTRNHFSSGHFKYKKRMQLTAVGSSGTCRACCGSRAYSSRTCRVFCAFGMTRAALVEHPGDSVGRHSAVPDQSRMAPIEHSAAPWQTRLGHFEYPAAPVRARVAISSHLRRAQDAGQGPRAYKSTYNENNKNCYICNYIALFSLSRNPRGTAAIVDWLSLIPELCQEFSVYQVL